MKRPKLELGGHLARRGSHLESKMVLKWNFIFLWKRQALFLSDFYFWSKYTRFWTKFSIFTFVTKIIHIYGSLDGRENMPGWDQKMISVIHVFTPQWRQSPPTPSLPIPFPTPMDGENQNFYFKYFFSDFVEQFTIKIEDLNNNTKSDILIMFYFVFFPKPAIELLDLNRQKDWIPKNSSIYMYYFVHLRKFLS